jgi:molecular chaperone GrpE
MEQERREQDGATAAGAADADARAEEFQKKYLYASAEIENTRKRMERQARESIQACRKDLLLKFLPVLDNLERALAYQDSQELRSGLAATLRGFESALQSEGVTPILTTGERFDPNVAEAIGTQQSPETEPGTILAEAQRGYLLDDALLRPAKVIVAKND